MPSTKETAEYFDSHAELLRADRLIDKGEALQHLLFSKLRIPSRVIEVGAGTGLYTFRLLADGHSVTAVDLSQECLDQIKGRAESLGLSPRVRFVCGDFLSVCHRFGVGSADAVAFIKVLHHFPDQTSIAAALAAAYELLAPGGKLIIFEPNGSNPLWRPVLASRGKDYWRNERNVLLIRRGFLEKSIRELKPANVRCSYRYVIPGAVIKRIPTLAALDEKICQREVRWLDFLAANIAFEVTKPA